MQQAFVISVLVAMPDGAALLLPGAEGLVADGRRHQPCRVARRRLAYIAGLPLAIGAFAAGMVCALATGYLKENSRIKQDTVMGVVFSGMFGLGIVLYTKIQTDVHLDHILFGDMLGVGWRDVAGNRRHRGARAAARSCSFRRDLLLHAFDPQHARAIGLPVRLLHYGLLAILSLTIVGALKAVGIILAIAMLIAPGAIAFLLTSRFDRMLMAAVPVAVLASFFGVYLSLLHRLRAGADDRAPDEPDLRRRLFRLAATGKAGRTPACRRNARSLISGETPEPGSRSLRA